MSTGRKRVTELTPEDLRAYPIWEFTLRGGTLEPNEGEVRPGPDLRAHDSSVGSGLFAVRTKFFLHDGSEVIGYCSPVSRPRGDGVLGYLTPVVVTESQHVPFWSVVDESPSHDDIQRYYSTLARSPEAIFPIHFQADVELQPTEVGAGVIEAFHFLVYHNDELEVVKIR